jgi:hypothetical protein
MVKSSPFHGVTLFNPTRKWRAQVRRPLPLLKHAILSSCLWQELATSHEGFGSHSAGPVVILQFSSLIANPVGDQACGNLSACTACRA